MDFKLTIKDFPLLCRFCLLQSNELEFISEIPSVDIFRILTGTELLEMLPKKICLTCIQVFKDFSAFIEKSKQNAEFLKAIFEESFKESCENFNNEEENNYDSGKEMDNKNGLIEDTTKHKVILKCTKNRRKYENNIKKKSLKKRRKCKNCSEQFSTLKLLSEHYKDATECAKSQKCMPKSTTLTCNCGVTFITRAQQYAHHKENPSCQSKDFNCLQCNKPFNKKHKLVTHMRSHTKEAPFECKECKKKFRFQQNLHRHILIHEGVKPFKCEVCGKAFSRAHVKNEHMNIHTGHNPYICMYCGKGFKRYANHFIHVYRHKLINGEVDKTKDKKLYLQLECNVCNRIFASRGGLANHLALHQEEPREKRFLCYECGKGFVTKAQLESHTRTHTGDRPYECNDCSKKFKQKSAFSNHQLTHSGEKPYKCKVCEKSFTQSGHLKVHMRVHSGEKPFVCNFCGKPFALKSNLKVHTRIHTGETPYICSVCGIGYYDSTSLKKHMKTHGLGIPSHGHIKGKGEKTVGEIILEEKNMEELGTIS